MPMKTKKVAIVHRGRKRMRGKGVKDVLRKAYDFLKRHKVISRGATALSSVLPDKYKGIATKIGSVSGALGYGRRRGGALRLAGGMRFAGM